jgi:hypothetical protein
LIGKAQEQGASHRIGTLLGSVFDKTSRASGATLGMKNRVLRGLPVWRSG